MRRVEKLRAGAALMGVTAIALMASAMPSAAEPITGTAHQATDGNTGYKIKVTDLDGKNPHDFDTKLFDLKVGDKTLNAYCVDIFTKLNFGTEYVETPWNKHSNENSHFNDKDHAAKINWLLQHGYPQLSTKDIAAKTGIKFKGDGLSAQEAITATQAAAWFFSDNVKLAKVLSADDGSTQDITDLYNYLIGEANTGDKDQPKPSLALEPTTLNGKPGSLIGPFVATTNAESVVVGAKVPAGVKITDKDGKELDGKKQSTKDKYEFYVNVPAGTADGKAEITISADATVSLGRLFVGRNPSQALILAGEGKAHLEAKAVANWAVTVSTPTTEAPPAPQAKNNELANTGASITVPVIIGVVLVGAGVGALLFQRRRKA